MPSLIPWYYKALASLAPLGLLVLGSYTAGYSRASKAGTLREARVAAQAASEHSRAILALRASENAAQARADAAVSMYEQHKEQYTRENTVLLTRVRNAEYRLRLPSEPVRSCPGASPAEAESTMDAAGACELSSGATRALFRIAERADACALNLTGLQDYVRGLHMLE